MGEHCRIIQDICFECATEQGYRFPEGHVASCWTGKCDSCQQERAVCSTRDYEWRGKAE